MSSEGPLYERDPEAWNAYLAEGNAKQARKRVSADVILRNADGNLLLVDPVQARLGSARRHGRSQLHEELGLDLQAGNLLCVEWVSAHGPWDDLLNFIFDGGILDDHAIASLQIMDDELRAYEFCDEGQAKERLRPYAWRRVQATLDAIATGQARYLQDGYA